MNETMISRKAKLFVESLEIQEEKVSETHNPKGFNLTPAKRNPLFKAEFESYRQGDVILKNMGNDKLPEGLQTLNTKIIAESFTTGHTHEFIDGDVEFLYDPKNEQSDVYVVVRSESLLAHQEHALHMIKPGTYQVRFQQTVIDNEPIRVID